MPTYNAHLEYRERAERLHDVEATLTKLHELLADFHPAVGFSPRGWLSIRITLPAETADQAFRIATLVVRDTLRNRLGFNDSSGELDPIVVEILTEAEFDAREGFVHIPDLVGVTEIADRLGITRQAAGQQIASWSTACKVGGSTWVAARSELDAKAAARV